MRAHDFISEALRPSQYRDYVKNWDKSRYNEIFGGKYRIYLPLQRSIEGIEPNKTVVDALESLGYTVTVEDYLAGYATKGKRKVKIGKIITNELSANPTFQDTVLQKFVNDPARAAQRDNLLVVISRHPYDIAGMSTDRGWSSCMNLNTGSMRQYVSVDVENGTLVAYLIKPTDTNINDPIARVLIKPFYNYKNPNNVIFGVEDRVYGTAPKEFGKTVSNWANAVNASKELDGLFTTPQGMYLDSVSSYKYFPTSDEETQLRALVYDPFIIKNIPNPSIQLQMAAVKRDAYVLRAIQNPDESVIDYALRADGDTIMYVKNPTEQQIRTAINSSPSALQFVENPSEELQKLAVSRRSNSIRYIYNPSEEIQLLAVLDQPFNIRYINNPSEAVQLEAVSHGTHEILGQLVSSGINPSNKVILAALKAGGHRVLRYVPNAPKEILKMAVKKDPNSIEYIDNPSEAIQMLAVRSDPTVISSIETPTERVQLQAIKNYEYAIHYINEPTDNAIKLVKKLWPRMYRRLVAKKVIPSVQDIETGSINEEQ